MTQLLANWAESYYKTFKKVFDLGVGVKRNFMEELYSVADSDMPIEYNQGLGEFGLIEDWDKSGRQVYYTDVSKGHKSTYTHKKYSIGTKIERELVMFNKYPQIKKKLTGLKESVDKSIQWHAMNLFNHAFDTTITGPDGYSLCYDSHPVIPNSSTTIDNSGTLELNAVNLETTRTAMMGWKDEQGNYLMVEPDLLLVPPALRKTARIIAETPEEPDITDHGINVWKGAVDVMECKLLTDSGRWFN